LPIFLRIAAVCMIEHYLADNIDAANIPRICLALQHFVFGASYSGYGQIVALRGFGGRHGCWSHAKHCHLAASKVKRTGHAAFRNAPIIGSSWFGDRAALRGSPMRSARILQGSEHFIDSSRVPRRIYAGLTRQPACRATMMMATKEL
jgi:hypothetical protein